MNRTVFCRTGIGAFLLFAGLILPGQAADSDQQTTSPEKTVNQPAEAPPNPLALFQLHYENRVKSFREQNRVYQNVILLGDSITEGFEVDRYFPGRRVLNRGIGADVIGNNLPETDKRGVLKRLDESVFSCAPAALFILIGINDLGQGHSPEVIEAGYREMLQAIRKREPALKIYVQSVLPTRGNFTKHKENVLDVNRRIKALAAEFQCEYVDLHSLMADDNGDLKAEFTGDGLHLTEEAYQVWRKVVEEKVGW